MDHLTSTIEDKVIKIFMENCPFLENNFKDSKLADLGINSINFVKIVVNLEIFFGFEFADEDLDYEKFEYLSDVCSYIEAVLE